ncbi:putative Transmembrane protein [Quillaja saponaria]|uniref:Transmembrane protein n=1 Tax=Quillaja saponaria TaxID=32244 RepID=A0AAD7VIZ8_QUISA|nr:putative Transmembrane protein [Quillaja saponaria]
MDNTFSKGKDIDFDLESGGNTSEDDASRDNDLGKQSSTNIVSRLWSRFLSSDGSSKDACAVESCSSSAKSDDLVDENVELLIDRNLGLEIQEHKTFVKNAYVKLKKKKTNPRKPPKPPRPPKGPSLDAADLKLVREIADLATRKRARVERMKAINKMKTAKASTSSSTGLSAMVITYLLPPCHNFSRNKL